MKVLVLGYFNRHNLGDDMFAHVFLNYFKKYWPHLTVVIKNPDQIQSIPDDTSLVICGGGDLINDYFLEKINFLIKPKIDYLPVYAVGMGIPFPNMIEEGAMDCFDYIIHRNYLEQNRMNDHYGGVVRTRFFPDLGFMLPAFSAQDITTIEYTFIKTNPGKKIGVFLSRSIFHPDFTDSYHQILDNLSYFLVKLARKKKKSKKRKMFCGGESKPEWSIYLIPSSTDQESKLQNDLIINQDLIKKINGYAQAGEEFNNIHIISDAMKPEEIIPVFQQFDFTICTRFHAHVFSILAEIPFISISSSHKVKSLLNECDLERYGIQMPVDPDTLVPIKLETWPLFEKYQLLTNNYQKYKSFLRDIKEEKSHEVKELKTYLKNLILLPLKHTEEGSPAFISLVRTHTRYIARRMILHYFPNLNKDQPEIYKKYLNGIINEVPDLNPFERFNLFDLIELSNASLKDHETIKFLTEVISYFITGQRETEYNFGLEEAIISPTYHLFSSVKWILNDFQIKNQQNYHKEIVNRLENQVMPEYRKLNMHYFKQHDLKGYHRSGWGYVIENLQFFHHNQGPIFDSFSDKTFGWDYEFLTKIGILPFEQAWVGVFHHTPQTDHSPNNLIEIFKKPLFIKSLKQCQGLWVLSRYLKDWLEDHLASHGFENILVDVLTHPTEIPDTKFTFQRFIDNPKKRVIQIGAWLRNSYAIYALPQPSNMIKSAIQSKNMEKYYPKAEYLPQIKQFLTSFDCADSNCNGDGCRPCSDSSNNQDPLANCNKYLLGMYQHLENNQKSVELIKHLKNDEYDQLLSANVVLINLVDASAVNTLIECIVRNTPILINRLPAVVEYLGPDYPLYYQNLAEASLLLNDWSKIEAGHQYLLGMDKYKFQMNTFLKNVVQSRIFKKIKVIMN